MQMPSWMMASLGALALLSPPSTFASAGRPGFASRIVDEVETQTIESPQDTDWKQPPAGCIEELVQQFVPCLDLSMVANPTSDLPPGLTEAEIKYWRVDHVADLNTCRAREVYRREAAVPGSVSKATIAWAWMWVKSAEDLPTKIDAVYEAASKAKMPIQVLFGALKQESLLSSLGIGPDGGNYSCGIGQINVREWCQAVSTLSPAEQAKFEWPVGTVCDEKILPTTIVKPFYDLAVKKLAGRPDYELTPTQFEGIRFDDVVAGFPDGDSEIQNLRFSAVASFVKYCSDVRNGIWAKGIILSQLYDSSVPSMLKKTQLYKSGETYGRKCAKDDTSNAYPFHTGWLLADGLYNAGAREVPLLEHYYRMTKEGYESGEAWKKMIPTDLIEGFHWGGKWNKKTNKIEFKDVYGKDFSQSWFKSCVVQRHIARVIQYGTLPGYTIAKSLETEGCSQTTVPEYRKKSSGKKDSRRRP